ncbi:unnamed protein product [Victoria cruziana]
MRLKKHKRNRKVVRFYSTCYGFREPFKVLCDGTFLHHLVLNKLGSPPEVLSSLLSARTMLFTTRCIISELKRLGESFSESVKNALSLQIIKCEHPNRGSASNCIEAIIKDNNSGHFFVASQDADLRKKFREIPGVPAIYAIRNSLFLDQPSTCHLQFVKTAEEERLHMKELEEMPQKEEKHTANVQIGHLMQRIKLSSNEKKQRAQIHYHVKRRKPQKVVLLLDQLVDWLLQLTEAVPSK